MDLADKHGLSKMTMDEITEEVKAVRKNTKKNKTHLSEELAGCLKEVKPLSDEEIKLMYAKDKHNAVFNSEKRNGRNRV